MRRPRILTLAISALLIGVTVLVAQAGGPATAHRYGNAGDALAGDPRVYGRVYLGTNGRGILYADRQGAAVTVRDAGWKGALARAATTTFGFLGAWTGSNPVPAALTCAPTF